MAAPTAPLPQSSLDVSDVTAVIPYLVGVGGTATFLAHFALNGFASNGAWFFQTRAANEGEPEGISKGLYWTDFVVTSLCKLFILIMGIVCFSYYSYARDARTDDPVVYTIADVFWFVTGSVCMYVVLFGHWTADVLAYNAGIRPGGLVQIGPYEKTPDKKMSLYRGAIGFNYVSNLGALAAFLGAGIGTLYNADELLVPQQISTWLTLACGLVMFAIFVLIVEKMGRDNSTGDFLESVDHHLDNKIAERTELTHSRFGVLMLPHYTTMFDDAGRYSIPAIVIAFCFLLSTILLILLQSVVQAGIYGGFTMITALIYSAVHRRIDFFIPVFITLSAAFIGGMYASELLSLQYSADLTTDGARANFNIMTIAPDPSYVPVHISSGTTVYGFLWVSVVMSIIAFTTSLYFHFAPAWFRQIIADRYNGASAWFRGCFRSAVKAENQMAEDSSKLLGSHSSISTSASSRRRSTRGSN